MVYDIVYPPHSCGRVVDYCTHEDTQIFFCIFCKKVIGAAKVTIKVKTEMKEYDEELRRALV